MGCYDIDELVTCDRTWHLRPRRWARQTFPPRRGTMSLRDPSSTTALGSTGVVYAAMVVGDRGLPRASWCLDPGHQPLVITEVLRPRDAASERNSDCFEIVNLVTAAGRHGRMEIVGGDLKSPTLTSLIPFAPGLIQCWPPTSDANTANAS